MDKSKKYKAFGVLKNKCIKGTYDLQVWESLIYLTAQYFKKYLLYVTWKPQLQREGKKQKEIFLLFIHSPKRLQWIKPGWSKAESQGLLPGLSQVYMGSGHWATLYCLAQATARNWIRSRAPGLKIVPIWVVMATGGWLARYIKPLNKLSFKMNDLSTCR